MLTRNKKLKDYGIPAEDIEKLNTMLKDFPAEYGYLLSSAALSACPKNTVIADMVIENILHRKSYRKISKEKYIPMNPKDFYGYRRKTVAVLYERMRLLAKLICQNGYQIGQKRLFQWMRDNGYLMVSGSSRNMPKQKYVEQGLFEIKESNVQNPDGSVRITRTTKVSGKGQLYFVNKFLGQETEKADGY